MTPKPKLSITIIGHKEDYHLEELLPTLTWADEVVYVDCESEDKSLEIAGKNGCKTYSRENNMNLNVNKSFAMDQSSGDWVFYLDPDERIPDNLRDEILDKIASDSKHNAFHLDRRNHYFGNWLRFGSQYPDTQLRLFRRGFAKFPNQHVHEKLIIEGSTGKLSADLLHFPYLSISQYLKKFDFYTSFEANFLYNSGTKPAFSLAFKYWFWAPFSRFIRRFLFKGGFRDGWPGFFAAFFDGLNFMVRYFKFIELYQKASTDNDN